MPRAAKHSTGRSHWERQRGAIRAAKAAERQVQPAQDDPQACRLNHCGPLTPKCPPGIGCRERLAPAPRFTFPPPAEPATDPPPPAPGTYRIDQLRFGQCRFACTPHGAREHRFCGAPTGVGVGNPHGSWCAKHLPVIRDTEARLGRPAFLKNAARSAR